MHPKQGRIPVEFQERAPFHRKSVYPERAVLLRNRGQVSQGAVYVNFQKIDFFHPAQTSLQSLPFIIEERRQLVDHYAAGQAEPGFPEKLPNGFSNAAGIIVRHECIPAMEDRVFDLAEAELKPLPLRVVQMTASEND